MIVAWAGATCARTWFVRADGSGDAPTILAAVDSSAAGDTVLVGPGAYEISDQIWLKAGMVVMSEQGPVETRLMPPPSAPLAPAFVCKDLWSASPTLIVGFWFEGFNTSAFYEGVIAILHSYIVQVENNVFADNNQPAVSIDPASSVVVGFNSIISDASDVLAGGNWYYDSVIGNIIWGRAPNLRAQAIGNCMKNVLDAGENFSLNFDDDPQFCGAPGSDNYYIQSDSPCAPESSSYGLIGALPVGCGPVGVDATSWGYIKAIYE